MKKKVLFIIPSFNGGGAQKVVIRLLKSLDTEKYDLSIAVLERKGELIKELPNQINVYDLGVKRVRKSAVALYKLVKKIKPDTVFSTLGHLNILLIILSLFLPKEIKLIVRESTIVSEKLKHEKHPLLWKFLYKNVYSFADNIVCQSEFMLRDLVENFGINERKVLKIYNPLDFEKIEQDIEMSKSPYTIENSINVVAIGRIEKVKDYNKLIRSISSEIYKDSNIHLWILGEGKLRTELEHQVRELGLQRNIHFLGFKSDIIPWLRYSNLFVLCSLYEGLPNVLLEAIACRCPVICTEHPGGTKEILEITGQKNRFVKEIVWSNPDLFKKPSENSFDLLKINFNKKNILQKYEEIL